MRHRRPDPADDLPTDGGGQRRDYPYTPQGHVDFLKARAAYKGHGARWRVVGRPGQQTCEPVQ